MEVLIKVCWGLLGAIHLTPSLVLFRPSLIETLYGVDPAGTIGVLLVHRAGMFLTVVILAMVAIWYPGTRRIAALVTAISMISFLLVYARSGMPPGQLRTIAWSDVGGLLPLAFVCLAALRQPHAL